MNASWVLHLEARAELMTDAQAVVYLALQDEQDRNGGWPVTVRHLCELTGLSSPSTVHAHLNNLILAGLVEASPNPRGGYRTAAQ